jgi:hypothetical protein
MEDNPVHIEQEHSRARSSLAGKRGHSTVRLSGRARAASVAVRDWY